MDHFQEHCEYEANAAFDAINEAFAATAEDARQFAIDEQAALDREYAATLADRKARAVPCHGYVPFDDEIPF